MLQIPKDQMTPFERMNAFNKGEAIDRVPCCPFTGESFAPYFGHSIAKFNHSTEVIVDTITKTFELFKADNCSIGPGLHGLPEAMGCTLSFPENGTPAVIKSAILDYSDLLGMSVVRPYEDGRLKYYLEAIKVVQERLKGQVNVGNTVGGPFTTAAFLVGTDKFLRDLSKNPEGIHRLLAFATESVMALMDAIMDLGITPGIADPIASCTMISPKVYQEFAQPYTTQCQNHIKKRMGSGGAIHICGKTQKIWSSMVATGVTAISLDNGDDIGELRRAHGHEVALVGNVDPVNVIMKGSTAQIYSAVESCIEKAKGSPNGFILASGCDIPIGTDPQKIHDFINGARLYGRL
jgi:uroporphyrinogen decarboxylase